MTLLEGEGELGGAHPVMDGDADADAEVGEEFDADAEADGHDEFDDDPASSGGGHGPDRSGFGPVEVIDPSSPRWRPWVALLVVLALMGFATWAQVDTLQTATRLSELPRLELPSVSGLDTATARARLEDLGFVVDVEAQPNDDPAKPKGVAFQQDPPAGAKVEQGGVVTVIVSDGPAGQTVPDVTGQQVGDAQGVLQLSGLASDVETVPNDTAPAGEVLRTDPEPGGRIGLNSAVLLEVSSGPAPEVVPEIVGLNIANALADLGRAGLGIGDIDTVQTADFPEGTVISVTPPAGTELPHDMPVDLEIVGPPPKVPVPSVVGLLPGTAASEISRGGLVGSRLTTEVSPGDPMAGRVVSQGLPAFAQVSEGVVVSYVVATVAVHEPAAPPTTAAPG